MKCAFLFREIFAGGGERVTLNTIRLFRQMGIESSIFTLKTTDSIFTPGDATGLMLQFPHTKRLFVPENLRFLVEKIKEQNIKVLFLIGWGGTYEALAAVKAETDVCLVHWEHNAPLYRFTAKRAGAAHRANDSLPKWLEWQTIGKLKYVYTPLGLWREFKAYRTRLQQVDRYIVLCDGFKEEICEMLRLADDKKNLIVPMYNTIELPHETVTVKDKQIIYMGRLTYSDKRVDRLVEVWRRVHEQLPDWRLDIYGDGPERTNLQTLIERYRLPRISLSGYVEHPASIYRQAAVLCMTSTSEGYPMAMIEAQSHGVVPLAFECCSGMRSIIGADQRAGVLVPPFDLDTYATQLVSLCRDEGRRAELQEGAIRKSLDYAHHTNIPHWHRFFASLGLEM